MIFRKIMKINFFLSINWFILIYYCSSNLFSMEGNILLKKWINGSRRDLNGVLNTQYIDFSTMHGFCIKRRGFFLNFQCSPGVLFVNSFLLSGMNEESDFIIFCACSIPDMNAPWAVEKYFSWQASPANKTTGWLSSKLPLFPLPFPE